VQLRLRDVFEAAGSSLKKALDRNSAEEFKVRESTELWSKIQWETRALGLLAHLTLGEIKHFRSHDVMDALPEIIHAGAVLHTIGMVADRSRHSSEPMRY